MSKLNRTQQPLTIVDTQLKKIFQKLTSPVKIQDFLDTIPMNFETKGETYHSPLLMIQQHTAHCMEGALFAAACLWYHGEKPLLLDLKVHEPDVDHVVALYRRNGLWGAISKTNHATVRFRDPIYRTLRELALSYFHEYFLDSNGKKTLYSYSRPFSLVPFGSTWVTSTESQYPLVEALDDSKHFELFPTGQKKYIRKADAMERKAGSLREWAS